MLNAALCIWLDCSYPQQQFPEGLPFQQATVTAQFKTFYSKTPEKFSLGSASEKNLKIR